MSEGRAARLKRLKMRSMRRGTKEMDLILGAFADTRLDDLAADRVAIYDTLLNENDHDLYKWITGQSPVPERFSDLIRDISDHAQAP